MVYINYIDYFYSFLSITDVRNFRTSVIEKSKSTDLIMFAEKFKNESDWKEGTKKRMEVL